MTAGLLRPFIFTSSELTQSFRLVILLVLSGRADVIGEDSNVRNFFYCPLPAFISDSLQSFELLLRLAFQLVDFFFKS